MSEAIASYFAAARANAEANDKAEASRPTHFSRRRRQPLTPEVVASKKVEYYVDCNYIPPTGSLDRYIIPKNFVIPLTALSVWEAEPNVQYVMSSLNAWRAAAGEPPFIINPYYMTEAINAAHTYRQYGGEGLDIQPSNPWGLSRSDRFHTIGCEAPPVEFNQFNPAWWTDEHFVSWWKTNYRFQYAHSPYTNIGLACVLNYAGTQKRWTVFIGNGSAYTKPAPTKTIWNPTVRLGTTVINIGSL